MASLVLILSELLWPEKAMLPSNCSSSRDAISAAAAAAAAAAFGKARSGTSKPTRTASKSDNGDAFDEDPSQARVSVEPIWP